MSILDRILVALVPIVISVVAAVAIVKYVPGIAGTQGVVVLDAVRLNNAFRAAAAPLIGKDQEGREVSAVDLSVTGARTLEAINKVADGRLVLIKQATVGESRMRDITADVLAELNLHDASATPMADPDSTINQLSKYATRPAGATEGKWQDKVLP